MHLVYRTIEKEPVPSVLPLALIPPSKRKNKAALVGGVPVLPGGVPVLPMTVGGRSTPTQRSDSPSVRLKFNLVPTVYWFL